MILALDDEVPTAWSTRSGRDEAILDALVHRARARPLTDDRLAASPTASTAPSSSSATASPS